MATCREKPNRGRQRQRGTPEPSLSPSQAERLLGQVLHLPPPRTQCLQSVLPLRKALGGKS